MQDIAELERRISAALERIGQGVARLSTPQLEAGPPSAMLPESDFAALNEALDEERMLNAQLNERLRVVHQKESAEKAALEQQISDLNAQLAAQSDELAQLRASSGQLNAELSDLRDAASMGVVEPEQINRALQAEVQALRAARAAEAAELADIVAALNPLIEEAAHA